MQAVGGSVDQSLALAVQAGESHEKEEAIDEADRALQWMRRMDALLHTRPDRRLETWMQATRAYAKTDEESCIL